VVGPQMTSDELKMIWSPESRLSDIYATLDSYAVEIVKDNLVYRRCPLHAVELYEPLDSSPKIDFKTFTIPAMDFKTEVRMIRFGLPPGETDYLSHRERKPRWPFFVEHPIRIMFLLADQWWDYRFTPGKKYEDRRMEYEK
jgi:hypothetical protein